MWHDISTAPLARELELAVIDTDVHTLVFPCFRTETHWRWWPIATYSFCCGG
jgi:hypothetical protein